MPDFNHLSDDELLAEHKRAQAYAKALYGEILWRDRRANSKDLWMKANDIDPSRRDSSWRNPTIATPPPKASRPKAISPIVDLDI